MKSICESEALVTQFLINRGRIVQQKKKRMIETKTLTNLRGTTNLAVAKKNPTEPNA